jgi:hypothetical protein
VDGGVRPTAGTPVGDAGGENEGRQGGGGMNDLHGPAGEDDNDGAGGGEEEGDEGGGGDF